MTKKDEPDNQPDPEPDEPAADAPEEPVDEINLDKLIEDKVAAALEKVTGEPAPKAEPSTEPAPAVTSSSSGTSSSGDSDLETRVERVIKRTRLEDEVADLKSKVDAPKPPKERKGLAKILWG